MKDRKTRHINLILIIGVAILFWTTGTVFNGDLAAKDEETYEGLKVFSDVIELVEKNYVDEVDTKELIQKAIQGMVQSLDPHSMLMPPEAFEDLQTQTKGKFMGIGIHITMQKGLVTVISPIEGTPAYKAGIKAGDRIIKVDDKTTRDLLQAVKMMRGPKGTKVKVTVLRNGVKEPMDFNLVRDVIPIQSIKYLSLEPGYGYVRITDFNAGTTKDLNKALQDLESDDPPP